MKADGGALQSSGTDYADVPVLSSDFRSSYVPVRTFVFLHLVQMHFQVDADEPIVLQGIVTC